MGERDPGERRAGDGRRNAGHDLERHAGVCKRERFLAAAPEHEGIARFQPHDAAAESRGGNQIGIDLRLGDGLDAGTFRDSLAGGLRRECEHRLGNQSVVENHVGRSQALDCAPRQQIGIARTGANDRDESAH